MLTFLNPSISINAVTKLLKISQKFCIVRDIEPLELIISEGVAAVGITISMDILLGILSPWS